MHNLANNTNFDAKPTSVDTNKVHATKPRKIINPFEHIDVKTATAEAITADIVTLKPRTPFNPFIYLPGHPNYKGDEATATPQTMATTATSEGTSPEITEVGATTSVAPRRIEIEFTTTRTQSPTIPQQTATSGNAFDKLLGMFANNGRERFREMAMVSPRQSPKSNHTL